MNSDPGRSGQLMAQQQEQQQYQGPERRQSQSQYQGEERRRPAPVTAMRTQQRLEDQEERRRQQARYDDIH